MIPAARESQYCTFEGWNMLNRLVVREWAECDRSLEEGQQTYCITLHKSHADAETYIARFSRRKTISPTGKWLQPHVRTRVAQVDSATFERVKRSKCGCRIRQQPPVFRFVG